MTVYSVTDRLTGKVRLVDAPNIPAALRHVATDVFEVKRPSHREVGHLVKGGVEMEDYVPARHVEAEAELPVGQQGGGE